LFKQINKNVIWIVKTFSHYILIISRDKINSVAAKRNIHQIFKNKYSDTTNGTYDFFMYHIKLYNQRYMVLHPNISLKYINYKSVLTEKV
jgi:hypothetical protein